MIEYGLYKTGILWELLIGDNKYSFETIEEAAEKIEELLGVSDD